MNKIIDKINTTIEQDESGVFNQFITPQEESSGNKVKKDFVKNFLIGILILMIVVAAGAFIFTQILDKQVEAKKSQLSHYDSSPEIDYLEENLPEMKNLSQRLKLVNSVYESKMYVASLLFPILESLVESSHDSYVYFNSFNFRKTNDDKKSLVSLSGMAIDYPSLYRQIQNFKNSPRIQNLRMGSMSLESDGFVSFNVTFNISLSPTDYLNFINNTLSEYELEDASGTGPLFQIEPVATSTEALDEDIEDNIEIDNTINEEEAEDGGETKDDDNNNEREGGGGLSDFLFGR